MWILSELALANIEKHANATAVKINASLSIADQVVVTVVDNGIGIGDKKSPDNHYGLIIMEDRARSLGGTVEIADGDSKGTVVTVTFTPEKSLIDT